MKFDLHSLTLTTVIFGALTIPRQSFAAGVDHAGLVEKYTKIASLQQTLIDETLALKAHNLAHFVPKAFAGGPVAQADRGYDAVIAAASKEKTELERFAKWHQLETAGAFSRIDGLVAEQKTIVADNLKSKAQAHSGYLNEKLTPRSRYVEKDQQYEAKIDAATAELSDLQGYVEWHKLASIGTAAEIAQLDADQQAVVAEHVKMKIGNRANYQNEKITPSSRYVAMDNHCDKLIADASEELSVLKEFSKN